MTEIKFPKDVPFFSIHRRFQMTGQNRTTRTEIPQGPTFQFEYGGHDAVRFQGTRVMTAPQYNRFRHFFRHVLNNGTLWFLVDDWHLITGLFDGWKRDSEGWFVAEDGLYRKAERNEARHDYDVYGRYTLLEEAAATNYLGLSASFATGRLWSTSPGLSSFVAASAFDGLDNATRYHNTSGRNNRSIKQDLGPRVSGTLVLSAVVEPLTSTTFALAVRDEQDVTWDGVLASWGGDDVTWGFTSSLNPEDPSAVRVFNFASLSWNVAGGGYRKIGQGPNGGKLFRVWTPLAIENEKEYGPLTFIAFPTGKTGADAQAVLHHLQAETATLTTPIVNETPDLEWSTVAVGNLVDSPTTFNNYSTTLAGSAEVSDYFGAKALRVFPNWPLDPTSAVTVSGSATPTGSRTYRFVVSGSAKISKLVIATNTRTLLAFDTVNGAATEVDQTVELSSRKIDEASNTWELEIYAPSGIAGPDLVIRPGPDSEFVGGIDFFTVGLARIYAGRLQTLSRDYTRAPDLGSTARVRFIPPYNAKPEGVDYEVQAEYEVIR